MKHSDPQPHKPRGHDPDDDPYPARCPCGELILTPLQRRQHIRHCPHYTDGLNPVTIKNPEEAER
jgi:hypothetical protein